VSLQSKRLFLNKIEESVPFQGAFKKMAVKNVKNFFFFFFFSFGTRGSR
jgi:hypothetical protein